MFSVGEIVAHPLHGACVITKLVERRESGTLLQYYSLTSTTENVTLMVPVQGENRVGLRPILGESEARGLLAQIGSLEPTDTQNWNRRYRENMERIRSGNVMEVCRVIRSLLLRNDERGLSTGERKMLYAAERIVISELVISLKMDFPAVRVLVENAARNIPNKEDSV